MKATLSASSASAVRTRRAYFDCQFGQLHVRTAFPGTGGFDEQVTLVCLHATRGSGRSFEPILQGLAAERSVYAPDLPGCGESDPSPQSTVAEAATAVLDFVGNLRLRRIDLLGLDQGIEVLRLLAELRPELVRRLVLAGSAVSTPTLKHENLVLQLNAEDIGTQVKPIRGFLNRSQ